MIAVIFELEPQSDEKETYFNIAESLRPLLNEIDGFISIERFQSLREPSCYLSLSFWRDEASVKEWRNKEGHRMAQKRGRTEIFVDYRLRIASVQRDYSMTNREQAPLDSKELHDQR